jgi:hypothetical protein
VCNHFLFQQARIKRHCLQATPGHVQAQAGKKPLQGKAQVILIAVHPDSANKKDNADDDSRHRTDGAPGIFLSAQRNRVDHRAEGS